CVVRVRAHGGGMEDVSKGPFSITVPYFRASCPSPNFACRDAGQTLVGQVGGVALHLFNDGTAPLTISSVTSDDGQFWPGRTSLGVGGGASDTVGVFYGPIMVGFDTAYVTRVANDPSARHVVTVTGRGVTTVGVGGGNPTAFGCWQNRPNP